MPVKFTKKKDLPTKLGRRIETKDNAYKTEGEKFSADDVNDYAKRVASYSVDPHYVTQQTIEFGKALTGLPLYSYQLEPIYRIIYGVITVEGTTITMIFSRQSGKSESLAFIACTLCVLLPALAKSELVKAIPALEQYKDGIAIGLFAPQSDQVVTTYSRAMMRISSDNAQMIMEDPEIDVGLTSSVRMEFTNGSFMRGQTASKTSKIESKTYDLILLEEAQDHDDLIVTKSIEPMLTHTNGMMVKSGTTGTRKNQFWYDIQENIRLSRKIKDVRMRYHFQNDYKSVIQARREQFKIDGKQFHLNYERKVMEIKRRLGEDSDAFRLAYRLLWALDTGMFISDADWARMCNKKKGLTDSNKIKNNWFIVAGLDLGKENDSTVLTIARSYYLRDEDHKIDERRRRDSEFDDVPCKEILCWLQMDGEDYEFQHRAIMDYLVEYKVDVLYVDYTGVGKPVGDRLMFDCGEYVMVVPYTFSKQSKSEMWQNFMADIKAGRLIVPANKTTQDTIEFANFEDQMKNLQKWWDGPFLFAEAPETEHDDFSDACALMCMAGNVVTDDTVEETLQNPFFPKAYGTRLEIEKNRW